MEEPAHAPDLGAFEGWEMTGKPLRFRPSPGGAQLQAMVLTRDSADDRLLRLVVARLAGQVMAVAPLGRIRVGGTARREVLAALTPWPLGGGAAGLRVDISVFELAPPRRFAVKVVLLEILGAEPKILLERLVESGDDAQDRRAILEARDLDGDGAPELLVDEHDRGERTRKLTYRRRPGGTFQTRDRSLFDEE